MAGFIVKIYGELRYARCGSVRPRSGKARGAGGGQRANSRALNNTIEKINRTAASFLGYGDKFWPILKEVLVLSIRFPANHLARRFGGAA